MSSGKIEVIVLSSSSSEDDDDDSRSSTSSPSLMAGLSPDDSFRPASRNSNTGSSTDFSTDGSTNTSDSNGPSGSNGPSSSHSGNPTAASTSVTGEVNNHNHENEEMRNDLDLIMTLEKAQCAFCFTDLNPGEGIMLRSCLHNFCMDCIQSLIHQSDSAQIPCPSVHTGNTCNGILNDQEVKALVSPEAYQNYLNRSLKTAEKEMEELSYCQSPHCSGVYSVPKEALIFKCLLCEAYTCQKCKSVRDNEDQCKCQSGKRPSSSGDSGLPQKICKIDPEVRKDWEANWAQISQSVSTPTASSSSAFGSGGDGGSMLDVLNKMEQTDLIKSTQEFNCPICFMDIPPGDGVILTECFHVFCKDCLAGTIEHCEEVIVKCPFQMNDYSCSGFISNREIKALLSPESHEKFVSRSVNQAEMAMGSSSFHCKTVNCTSWCEFEEGVNLFKCPVCTKHNCLKCRAIHETISCQEYQSQLQEDEMDIKTKKVFADMIKKGTAMKCPTCKIMIQKTAGCDGMMCSCCKTHICWATKGPRWGPMGVGDRSGGCHCREKQGKGRIVMCHPKCKGCH